MRYLLPVIGLIAALWVFSDSQKRGYSVGRSLLWAIGVMFIVFIQLYFILRNKIQPAASAEGTPQTPPLTICYHCGQPYEGRPNFCSNCGQKL
jgi:hypothetical protein